MKSIKVKFINQWKPGNSPAPDSVLGRVLFQHYDVIIDNENPDYVLTQAFRREALGEYNDKIVIFETGEAVVPDFNLVDYAIGYDDISFADRYFSFPYHFHNWRELNVMNDNKPSFCDLEFCNFIYSNPRAHPLRDHFYHFLSDYKKIDSYGRHLNNMELPSTRGEENWQEIKMNIQSKYKFTIAFENACHDGYATEKIGDAFNAGTIPIYFGDLCVDRLFNTDAFIWIKISEDFLPALKRIQEIEGNEELFRRVQSEPKLSLDLVAKEKELESFVKSIFDQDLNRARRKAIGASQNNYAKKDRKLYEKKKSPLQKLLKKLKR
jgi:hypothetical protein